MIKTILRKMLDASLTSNKVSSIYINSTSYKFYHGRIIETRTNGIINTDRHQLMIMSINMYK